MLGLMAHSVRHGYLCRFNEPEPLSIDDLAITVGASVEEVKKCLQELESKGVFSRCHKGIIYSRRILKDATRRRLNRKYQRDKRQNGRINLLSSGSYKSVRPVSVERPETKNHSSELRDERLKRLDTTGAQRGYIEPKAITPIDTNAVVKSIINGAVSSVAVENLNHPSLEQFIRDGMSFRLSRQQSEKEYRKLQKRGWMDSKGHPIKDISIYLNAIAANKIKGL